MFQLHKLPYLCCTFIFICLSMFCFCTKKVQAMKVTHYSYDKVKAALPANKRTEEYIYILSSGKPGIAFATYDENGDYFTSVKKRVGQNDFLYCIDHTKLITFNKAYGKTTKFFNNELTIRIGIAMEYGTRKWGQKASKEFTTGNAILDYYMTQVVIQSLIHKYGKTKANLGMNFKLFKFKSGTATLKKKTTALYQFCCNAEIKKKENYFKTTDFSFEKPQDNRLLLNGNTFTTPIIKCKIGSNNAEVSSFSRTVNSETVNKSNITLTAVSNTYNSDCKVTIPKDIIDKISPGVYSFSISETVNFTKDDATIWYCNDENFKDTNQSVCGTIPANASAKDNLNFELLIGNAVLCKKNSINGENISDAVFELFQFNDSTNKYENYKKLEYNNQRKRYETGNIYLSENNKSAKFKIIETKAGKNFLNDWDGVEFTITKDIFSYEFDVENQPILGKLKIKKTGEDFIYEDEKIKKKNTIPLEGVTFSLYPSENIYLNGKIFYPKDKLIANLITDKNGEAIVKDLLPGNYYLKEVNASLLYEIEEKPENITIIFDKEKESNDINIEILNKLKDCEISLFKYYVLNNDEKKIPLKGVKFGLYAGEDIKNGVNNTIIKKDSLIKTGVTDENGNIQFEQLLFADYYLRELAVPEGFTVSNTVIPISKNKFTADTLNKKYLFKTSVENKAILGRLKIQKSGEQVNFKENSLIEAENILLSGVKFELYAKNDIIFNGKKIYAKDDKITELFTDIKGEAEIKDLFPGEYYIKEVSVLPLYTLDSSSTSFSISSNNTDNIVNLSIINKLKKCKVDIFKYYLSNEQKEKKIPLKDAKFGLYAKNDILGGDGNIIIKKDSLIMEKYSDGNGEIIFNDLLYGDYYLKELEAPKDFMINDGILVIDKKDFSLDQGTTTEYTAQKEIINKKCTAHIKIKKYGDVLSDYKDEKSDNGQFITYICNKQPLENVTFSLYDAEKQLIISEATDSEGNAYFKNLEPGKYYYKEELCPDMYQINNKYIPITLEIDNENYIECNPPVIENMAEDELCGCYLTLTKYGEQAVVDNKILTYSEIPLKDILFGIYQDFDYVFASGKKAVKDSCVGYLVTNENGKAEFRGKLPLGKYYIRELKTNTGYQIDNNLYPFEIIANQNNEIEICLDNNQHFLNLLSKASVMIKKTDADTGKSLKNVEFTLYNESGQQIGVYKTNKKGLIIVENLPYGTYYFVETKCKNGYYSTNNKYKFTLNSEEQIILDITNSPILKLGFSEHYKLALLLVFVLVASMFVFGIRNLKKAKR